MNKARVDTLIPLAYQALSEVGVVEGGVIQKSFRSQISSFGASVVMGSLLAAIAFFSEQNKALVDRAQLMNTILSTLQKAGTAPAAETVLYRWAEAELRAGRGVECREEIVNAAIAIKLAMNLYCLK